MTLGVEARLHLLRENRDAVAVMLARAATGGIDPGESVVVVVDQRDEVGKELALAAAERVGLDAGFEANRAEAKGDIPTAIIVVPLSSSEILFRGTHPTVARGLAQSPLPGRVRVVVVAEGSAMLIHAAIHAPRITP